MKKTRTQSDIFADIRERDRLHKAVNVAALLAKIQRSKTLSLAEKTFVTSAVEQKAKAYEAHLLRAKDLSWTDRHYVSGEDDLGGHRTFFKKCGDEECRCQRGVRL